MSAGVKVTLLRYALENLRALGEKSVGLAHFLARGMSGQTIWRGTCWSMLAEQRLMARRAAEGPRNWQRTPKHKGV